MQNTKLKKVGIILGIGLLCLVGVAFMLWVATLISNFKNNSVNIDHNLSKNSSYSDQLQNRRMAPNISEAQDQIDQIEDNTAPLNNSSSSGQSKITKILQKGRKSLDNLGERLFFDRNRRNTLDNISNNSVSSDKLNKKRSNPTIPEDQREVNITNNIVNDHLSLNQLKNRRSSNQLKNRRSSYQSQNSNSTLDSVEERGEKLDTLKNKSEDLADSATNYSKSIRKLSKQFEYESNNVTGIGPLDKALNKIVK